MYGDNEVAKQAKAFTQKEYEAAVGLARGGGKAERQPLLGEVVERLEHQLKNLHAMTDVARELADSILGAELEQDTGTTAPATPDGARGQQIFTRLHRLEVGLGELMAQLNRLRAV